MKAFKLVRLLKNGEMSPLFINKSLRFKVGETYHAEFHPTKGFSSKRGAGLHCTLEPIAPHLTMNLKSGEKRIWIECEVEDYEMYDRPSSQGNSWVLAQTMTVIKVRPDIKTTTGEW